MSCPVFMAGRFVCKNNPTSRGLFLRLSNFKCEWSITTLTKLSARCMYQATNCTAMLMLFIIPLPFS